MNDTFNMNRFGLLLRRQWSENFKFYLLLWGVISISIICINIFFETQEYQVALFWLVFWLGGCAMVPSLFSRWTDPGRSSLFFLIPASPAEKFLCGLFYALIIFIPVYCLNIIFVRYILTYLIVMLFPNNMVPFTTFIQNGITEIKSNSFTYYLFSLLTFLFLQSVLMIVFIKFRKMQVLMFLILGLAVLFLYNLLLRNLVLEFADLPRGTIFTPGILLPHMNLGFGLYGKPGNPNFSEQFYFIRGIRDVNNIIWTVIFFFFYLSAGYMLKEREL